MCRVLSYLGRPIITEDLLYKPDNSFIKQSYHPTYMSHLLNLAGFGIYAWNYESYRPKEPYTYKTPNLPFYDDNLRNFASKIRSNCLLAHLRGVPYSEKQVISKENVHPFMFSDSNIALAHNGALADFEKMKFHLLEYVKPEYLDKIHGTTDSEWIYALFISQLTNSLATCSTDEIISAILETLKILKQVRHKCSIYTNSPVNLFISNGEFIAATRFVFDYGWWDSSDLHLAPHFAYHSLWYTYGESYGYYDNEYQMKSGDKRSSIIIASEPLTKDTTTWIEVPEYSLIVARIENSEVKIVSRDINI